MFSASYYLFETLEISINFYLYNSLKRVNFIKRNNQGVAFLKNYNSLLFVGKVSTNLTSAYKFGLLPGGKKENKPQGFKIRQKLYWHLVFPHCNIKPTNPNDIIS